jgi:hypothetical protein
MRIWELYRRFPHFKLSVDVDPIKQSVYKSIFDYCENSVRILKTEALVILDELYKAVDPRALRAMGIDESYIWSVIRDTYVLKQISAKNSSGQSVHIGYKIKPFDFDSILIGANINHYSAQDKEYFDTKIKDWVEQRGRLRIAI